MSARLSAQLLLWAALAPLSPKVVAGAVVVPNAPSRVEICSGARVVCATLKADLVEKTLDRKGYRWGGEDVDPPKAVVSLLTVVAGGQDVFVPLSAFADLGNPRTAEVEITSRGFNLIVSGGDASTSYRALLSFKGRTLIRRKVTHGEFPGDAWEETRYRFNQLKN